MLAIPYNMGYTVYNSQYYKVNTMVANLKSCYNTNDGTFLWEAEPTFTGKERDDFLKCCQYHSVLHTCVNSAASETLVNELEIFARSQYNQRVYGDGDLQDNNNGAGRYPTKMLLTILILKEHANISFKEVFERCLYDLRFRYALGIENVHYPVPKLRTIKAFSQLVNSFNEKKTAELGEKYSIYNEILRNLAASTISYFGKENYTTTVRVDSTPLGSNIAYQSRVEIVTSVLKSFLNRLPYEDVLKLSLQKRADEWEKMLVVLGLGGKRLSYETEDAGMPIIKWLGYCIALIIEDVENKVIEEIPEYKLLERVFLEQFSLIEPGEPSLKAGKDISADSLQNQNDPDASYRKKYDTPVRGESANVAEFVAEHETTTDENGNEVREQKAPHVITSVDVDTATANDTDFLAPAVDAAKKIADECDHKVGVVQGDGGYSGVGPKKEMEDKGVSLVTTELKGKEATFSYKLQEDGTVLVTDRSNSDNTYTAVPVNTRDGSRKWKFTAPDENGKEKSRYITERNLEIQEIREMQKDVTGETKKLRNNVEATVRELKRGLYNGKIRYCGILRILFALSAKTVGIQTRRIFNVSKRYGIDLPALCQNWK